MRSGAKEAKPRKIRIGQCIPNTMIVFDKTEGSSVNLVGKSKGYVLNSYSFCLVNLILIS